jgi:hypothetical protein
MTPPTTADFQQELDRIFQAAQDQRLSYIDVVSGDMHHELGGYLGKDHRLPLCYDVMHRNMQAGDEILQSPPKGQGATLMIRYRIPR